MKWYQFIFLAIIAFGIIGLVGYGVATSLTDRYIEEIVEARVEKRLAEMAEEAVEEGEPAKIVEKLIDVRYVAERLDAIPNLDRWTLYSDTNREGRLYSIRVYTEQEVPEVETVIEYDSDSLLETVNKILEVLDLELISEE